MAFLDRFDIVPKCLLIEYLYKHNKYCLSYFDDYDLNKICYYKNENDLLNNKESFEIDDIIIYILDRHSVDSPTKKNPWHKNYCYLIMCEYNSIYYVRELSKTSIDNIRYKDKRPKWLTDIKQFNSDF